MTSPGLTVYKGGAVVPRFYLIKQHLGDLEIDRQVVNVSVSYIPSPRLQLELEAPLSRTSYGDGITSGSGVGIGNVIAWANFWATWCPPCRAEIPDLVKWQRQYKRKGLQVIGVTYPPTNRREVQKFGRQMKMNYPVWLGSKATKALFDPGETLPFTVIIDREGNVRATIEGILLPEEFDEKVRPLLEQSNSAAGTVWINPGPRLP